MRLREVNTYDTRYCVHSWLIMKKMFLLSWNDIGFPGWKLSGWSNNIDCRETGTNNLVKKLVISSSFVFCCMFLYISFYGAMTGTIVCFNFRHIPMKLSTSKKNYQLIRLFFRDWWSAAAVSQQHQNILHLVAHRVLSTLQCPPQLTQQHKSQERILHTWESFSWN